MGRVAAGDGRQERPGLRVAGCASSSATAGSSPARPATCCGSTRPSSTSPLRAARRRGRQRADPERAAEKLREALALWRGPPLADLAYEPFAQAEIARLEELRLAALEQRIDAELAIGRHAELAGELEALVAEHPLRERLRGQLMLALYRSGRQAEALEAFRHARESLVDELGIEPDPTLQRLHASILRQDPSLDPPKRASPPDPGQPASAAAAAAPPHRTVGRAERPRASA